MVYMFWFCMKVCLQYLGSWEPVHMGTLEEGRNLRLREVY
jgi:hypothetical protein